MSSEAPSRAEIDSGEAPAPPSWPWIVLGAVVVLGLAALTQFLVTWVPEVTAGTGFGQVADSIEFPVYAIILGFLGNVILSALRIRRRLAPAFRTEFFIKTGVVLLGASINIAVIVRAALPSIAQAVLMISGVFFFTWWLAGLLHLDDKLRALLASALSICGVSAAIAAGGAVKAKKEQLAYVASLVIIFAVPAIFLLPWLSGILGLSPAVTGAWIGGNIDTTAAVSAAGAIAGEEPLQIATIVKVTQNALMGVVAVLLSLYFTFRVERSTGGERPGWGTVWERFPKFVLGFIAASIIATIFLSAAADPDGAKAAIGVVNNLRTWFLVLAFVSIGLEFQASSVREAGWQPVVVFAGATVFNLVLGLILASLLFGNFQV